MLRPVATTALIVCLIGTVFSPGALAQPSAVITFGGPEDETANAIAFDDAGNVYVAGAFEGTVDFDPSDPQDASDTATAIGVTADAYLASYSASGAFRWMIPLGLNGSEGLNAVAVEGDRVIVAGSFTSPQIDVDPGPGVVSLERRGETDGFVAAYALTGAYAWAFVLGGPELDNARTLTTWDGSVYVSALTEGIIDIDPGTGVESVGTANRVGLTVASFASADGAFNWGWSTVGNASLTGALDMAADGQRLLLAGQFFGTVDFDPGPGVVQHVSTPAGIAQSPIDGFVAAYTLSDGSFQWISTQTGPNFQSIRSVDSDGSHIYVSGAFAGTTDFDPGTGVVERTPMAGDTFDPFVAAFDAGTGALAWVNALAATAPGSGSEDANGVAVVGSRVYAVGMFLGSVDFDPGAGSAVRTAEGFQDGFIASFDKVDGSFADVNIISGPANEQPLDVAIFGTNVFVAGRYSVLGAGTQVDFDPGPGEVLRTSLGGFDVFVAGYPLPGGVDAASGPEQNRPRLSVAPNPSTSSARLTLRGATVGSALIELFDTLGRRIASLYDGPARQGGEITLQFPSGLTPGTYVLRAATDGSVQTLPITVLR